MRGAVIPLPLGSMVKKAKYLACKRLKISHSLFNKLYLRLSVDKTAKKSPQALKKISFQVAKLGKRHFGVTRD